MGRDGQVDSRDTVRGLENVETARLQDAAHQGAALGVVLDVQNPRLRLRR